MATGRADNGLIGVQRAGSQIAIDDPQGSQRGGGGQRPVRRGDLGAGVGFGVGVHDESFGDP